MTSGALTIIPPTPAETGLLLRLIRELAEYEKLGSHVVASESQLHDALFGSESSCQALLGYWDGEPVGFALYFYSFSTFLCRRGLYLEDLFVRESHRGLGIGRTFMRHLNGIAIANDVGRFEWSVLNWNESAIRFYESLGASRVSEWTVFRLDETGMQRLARAESEQGAS